MFLLDSYPTFVEVLWTTLVIFAWIIFFWILIVVLSDVFRRHDIGGGSKVVWVLFVIILPYLGVLVYLLINHQGMAERRMKDAAASQAQYADYVRSVAGSGGGPRPRSRRPRACSTAAPSPRPSTTRSRPRRWPAADSVQQLLQQAEIDEATDAARRERFRAGASIAFEDLEQAAGRRRSTGCATRSRCRGCRRSAAGW